MMMATTTTITSTSSSSSTRLQSAARRGLSSPPSLLGSARLFTRLSAGYAAQEQKMAELRAAYASPAPSSQPTATATNNQQQLANGSYLSTTTTGAKPTTTPKGTARNGIGTNNNNNNNNRRGAPSRSSLPFATTTGIAAAAGATTNGCLLDFGIGCVENDEDENNGMPTLMTMMNGSSSRRRSNGAGSVGTNSNASSRRGSAVANCAPTPSIMDLAASARLLSLSPSDLVFESSVLGIAYYDFILSVSEVCNTNSNISGGPSSSFVASTAGGGGHQCSSTNSTSSSCSSSTTIKEQQRGQQQQQQPQKNNNGFRQCSPSTKRRICTTGSEPTPNSSRDVDKGGPASMLLWKHQPQQQHPPPRPGTSMGIERSATPQLHPRANTADNVTAAAQMSSAQSSAFAKCVYRLFLAKLDAHTNVEWFESVVVPGELLEQNGIPANELSLLTMGILVWRSRLANSRLLCLANGQLGEDSTTALEALKRAAGKYKCMHHVLTVGQRRQSATSTHSSGSASSFRSSCSSGSHGQSQQDAGMKLRLLMCQTRSELAELPTQTLRDAKFLLAPNSNPLLCLCFPLT